MLVVYAFFIPIDSHAKSSLLVVMLAVFIYRGNVISYLRESISNKVVKAFVIFYFIWIIGLIYTDDMVYAMEGLYKAKYLLLPLFFLTFLNKKYSYRIITAFIIGMLFSEIVSYAISFHIIPYKFYIFGFQVYETIYSDPTPFFNHIEHGIGLSISISLLLYRMLNYKQSIAEKIFSILFISSASINMSLIGGRTGYILYVFLIIITFIVSSKKSIFKSLLFSILLVSLVAIMAFNLSEIVNRRVNQTIESLNKIYYTQNFETSIGIRVGLVKYSIEVIKENFILGVGTGDALNEVKTKIPKTYNGMGRMSELHNVYIQTMVQFGVLGLISLFYIFYNILAYKKNGKDNSNILFLLTISVLMVMLPGKFYGHFILPMYTTLVSAMITVRNEKINDNSGIKKEIFVYFILVMVFYLIAIFR